VSFPAFQRALATRRFATAALLLTVAVSVASCTNGQARQQSPDSAAGAGGGGRGRGGRGGDQGPVPVTTAAATEKAMAVTVSVPGGAEAISTVQIRSQVTGRLAEVHFAEGQEVEAGQPLFTIDPQPFQVALDQATAVLARDTAQANNAQTQVDRYKSLFDRGLIARDQYETQVATAAALKATTAADEAAIAAAKLNLQYTRINSPASGRTGALLVHKGDLVQANGPTSLVVINQMAPIYVTFAVSGKLLDDIRRFHRAHPLRVEVQTTEGENQSTETGQLTFIDNAVDPQTGTIRLKATFDNKDRALWPGEFVQTTLFLSAEPHAIVVPSIAVQPGQQGTYVWVVDQGQAQMRPVTVARVQGDESAVTGIKAGEVVVTDGQLRLTPGARIATRAGGRATGTAEAP
jgi:multidrug efflux system membrane fusion protein